MTKLNPRIQMQLLTRSGHRLARNTVKQATWVGKQVISGSKTLYDADLKPAVVQAILTGRKIAQGGRPAVKFDLEATVGQVASLGLPGIMLVLAIATSGYAGGAAITVGLATLGGPLGMVGGFISLGLVSVIGGALAKIGLENLLKFIYTERLKQENLSGLMAEIQGLPISREMKDTILEHLRS